MIWSHHLHLKESLLKVIRQNIAGWWQQTFCFQKLLTMPSNVLPSYLKRTFPLEIWIFTEGEGDGIEYRLPFKFLSKKTIAVEWYCVFFKTLRLSDPKFFDQTWYLFKIQLNFHHSLKKRNIYNCQRSKFFEKMSKMKFSVTLKKIWSNLQKLVYKKYI